MSTSESEFSNAAHAEKKLAYYTIGKNCPPIFYPRGYGLQFYIYDSAVPVVIVTNDNHDPVECQVLQKNDQTGDWGWLSLNDLGSNGLPPFMTKTLIEGQVITPIPFKGFVKAYIEDRETLQPAHEFAPADDAPSYSKVH